jgi:hypothetical protein
MCPAGSGFVQPVHDEHCSHHWRRHFCADWRGGQAGRVSKNKTGHATLLLKLFAPYVATTQDRHDCNLAGAEYLHACLLVSLEATAQPAVKQLAGLQPTAVLFHPLPSTCACSPGVIISYLIGDSAAILCAAFDFDVCPLS